MKIIFLIIDGLGDRPIPQLGNKTPLEAAKTPNFDWFAENGICGLVKPFWFPQQKYPRSDTAHLALFGYNPKVSYLGRGPYEAAGIGFHLQKGNIALRANFGTVNKNLKVIDRRAGRISRTQPLVKALNGIKISGVKFLVKKSFGHRAVLVLRCLKPDSKPLSEKISDGDPYKVGVKVKKIIPLDNSSASKFTAQILNKFLDKSHEILKDHPLNKKRKLPANYLLVRGAGKFKKTKSFYQKYKLRAACIAGGALYKGIGKILGMKLVEVKGATGLSNTNLKGKFLAVKKALKKQDFIFCHIKAVDSFGEDGNYRAKKEFLEKIDKNIAILKTLKNTLVVITGDHSTCSELKSHCSDPVPIVIYGNGKDNVQEFGERACKKGKLGTIKGLYLMPKISIFAKQRRKQRD